MLRRLVVTGAIAGMLAGSAEAATPRDTYRAGAWVYRAGWIQFAAGMGMVVGWGASSDWGAAPGDDGLVFAGGALALAAPLTMSVGSVISHGAVRRSVDPDATLAPASWGVAATLFCTGGFALNLTAGLAIPPVADCGFALALPGWQQANNHAAFRDWLQADAGAPPIERRPAVTLGLVPLVSGRQAGVGIFGAF